MENETQKQEHDMCSHHKCKKCRAGSTPCAVYGMAFVGAAVYFIQQADTFWMGVLGVLKAIIWPALLIYQLLGFLHL